MSGATMLALEKDLIRDEGTGPTRGDRLFPYFDCCGKPFRTCTCLAQGKPQGKLTLGHGRNIEDRGITRHEALTLLETDVAETDTDLRTHFPWAADLPPHRQRVVANMLFNMGVKTLSTFHATLAAMRAGDDSVVGHMLASKWARQVGARAQRLARLWVRE